MRIWKMAAVAMLAAMPMMGTCESDESGNAATIVADEAENGGTVRVAAGASLDIVLKGNPTTGYQWALESCDETILQPDNEPDYAVDSNLIGAGGTYTFHFKTLATGTATVKLIYHRSFEKDVPPIKTYTLTVEVMKPEKQNAE